MKERFIQAAAAALLLGTLPTAQAVATLNFYYDGALILSCADGNAACDDAVGTAGVVSVNDTIGAFTTNVTTGITKPALSDPLMELNSVLLKGGDSLAHTIIIEFSETGFTADGLISSDFTSNLSGSAGSTMTAEVEINGVEVIQFGPLGIGAFGLHADDGAAPDGAYSVLQRLTLATTAGTPVVLWSGDFEVHVVPEPVTLGLLGVGLGLFGFSMRRRLQAS